MPNQQTSPTDLCTVDEMIDALKERAANFFVYFERPAKEFDGSEFIVKHCGLGHVLVAQLELLKVSIIRDILRTAEEEEEEEDDDV